MSHRRDGIFVFVLASLAQRDDPAPTPARREVEEIRLSPWGVDLSLVTAAMIASGHVASDDVARPTTPTLH